MCPEFRLNVVLVMKIDDGSTKLVHADGVLASGWGECRYQVTGQAPVPGGQDAASVRGAGGGGAGTTRGRTRAFGAKTPK